jgi:tRNA pseudouridine13 synthase
MRLKVRPEDFRVRELLEFERDPQGEHFVHLLRKEKLDTVQALTEVARQCNVSRSDIAFAGLKDRQGVTEQWISVRGKRLEVRRRDLEVKFVGRAARAITSKQSQGNAFEIVLRALTEREVERLEVRGRNVQRSGFPNYYDDQRFGNVTHGQGFILRDVLAGDYERALQQLLAAPSPRAITGDVKLKRILRARWGDWDACAAIARGPAFRRVFGILRASGDFAAALAALPPRHKLIHAYAYQSYLWNRALSRWLRLELTPGNQTEVWTVLGRLRAWSKLPEAKVARLQGLEAPLFAGDLAGGEPSFRAALDAVLRREGVTVADCARAALPGLELKTELRPALLVPGALRLEGPRADKHGEGLAMKLSFTLPRGAYATMLIKCLTASRWGTQRRQSGGRLQTEAGGGGDE